MKPELTIPVLNLELKTDPHLMEDAPSMFLNLNLYRGLLRYLPDGSMKPDLAESWSVLKGGKTVIFKLRKATFSDGQKITANHVVISFARLFFLRASMSADLHYIRGVSRFLKSNKLSDLGVMALSEDEVQFDLARPSALLLRHLATVDCAILPLSDHKVAEVSSPEFPSSGPYVIRGNNPNWIDLERWRADSQQSSQPPQRVRIVRVKYEDLFDGARNGKFDTLDPFVVDKKTDSALKKRGWKDSVTEVTRERFLLMNPDVLPLKVRKAFFHAIDLNELMRRLQVPSLKPAWGIIPDGIAGALSKSDRQSLIAPKKEDSPIFTGPLILHLPLEMDISQKLGDYLQDRWKPLASKLVVKLVPARELFTKITKMKDALIFTAKGIDYPDGYSILSYFRSDFKGTLSFGPNRELDLAIRKLTSLDDESVRTQAYKNVQIQIMKGYTIIPLTFGSGASGLWSAKAAYVPPHPMGFHTLPLETIEVKQ